ncbi:MAG: hypothetical protein ACLFUS_01175 [Candidatus Sumerlaeia bacterium]
MAAEKTALPITAYTAHHRIEGEIILLKGEHLSDKLNLTERKFELIQNANVYPIEGAISLHHAETMAVNKDHITMMVPKDK